MNVAEARAITGGLSAPSKMPGHAYSLPARACLLGSKLRGIEGSRCHGCYAFRGNYLYENVQRALERRLEALGDPRWVEAMVVLVRWASGEHTGCKRDVCDGKGSRYFRWHDSGDLQGVGHLEQIVEVARGTPRVKHWLPTGEVGMVRSYMAERGGGVGVFPANLTVRLSATMVGGEAPRVGGLPVSSIHRGSEGVASVLAKGVRVCPAHDQGNMCGECRACWDRRVKHVSYRKH